MPPKLILRRDIWNGSSTNPISTMKYEYCGPIGLNFSPCPLVDKRLINANN